MRSVLRRGVIALTRRLLIAAVVIGAAIAFVYVAGGTGAQTGQPQLTGPIVISHDDASPAVSTPIPSVDAASSAPAEASAPITSHPPRSKSSTTSPAVIASTPASSPAPTTAVASPSPSFQIDVTRTGPNSKAAGALPSTYRYATYRDIAALINPLRALDQWGNVTTVPAQTSASCVTADACSAGQLGACNRAPSGIGTTTTTKVSDGQYKDQFGNCRELIVII
jgi:hypothetical protein